MSPSPRRQNVGRLWLRMPWGGVSRSLRWVKINCLLLPASLQLPKACVIRTEETTLQKEKKDTRLEKSRDLPSHWLLSCHYVSGPLRVSQQTCHLLHASRNCSVEWSYRGWNEMTWERVREQDKKKKKKSWRKKSKRKRRKKQKRDRDGKRDKKRKVGSNRGNHTRMEHQQTLYTNKKSTGRQWPQVQEWG